MATAFHGSGADTWEPARKAMPLQGGDTGAYTGHTQPRRARSPVVIRGM